jgi:hypothetical protein
MLICLCFIYKAMILFTSVRHFYRTAKDSITPLKVQKDLITLLKVEKNPITPGFFYYYCKSCSRRLFYI